MMSNERQRRLSTGPTRRRPLHLHRSSSDSSVLSNADVSTDQNTIEKSQNHLSAKDINDMSHERYNRSVTPHFSFNSEQEEADNSDDEVSNSSAEEAANEEEPINFSSDSDQIPSEIKSNNNNITSFSNFIMVCTILISLIIGVLCMMNSEQDFDINFIRKNLPTQDEELWLSLESGITDVLERNRPSTFVLLYEKEAEDTMYQLVDQLSKLVTCSLTDCSKKPIILENTELNSAEVIQNFGLLIDKYKNKLEESGVMVIKNLESVYGTSAQAFHVFCDEFTPLVAKSIIIFTMKVDKLPGYDKRMQFIENYLKNKWTDVKLDTRNALITRITSMVLEVQL